MNPAHRTAVYIGKSKCSDGIMFRIGDKKACIHKSDAYKIKKAISDQIHRLVLQEKDAARERTKKYEPVKAAYLVRGQDIYRRRMAGESFGSIAKIYGVQRERIRQIFIKQKFYVDMAVLTLKGEK